MDRADYKRAMDRIAAPEATVDALIERVQGGSCKMKPCRRLNLRACTAMAAVLCMLTVSAAAVAGQVQNYFQNRWGDTYGLLAPLVNEADQSAENERYRVTLTNTLFEPEKATMIVSIEALAQGDWDALAAERPYITVQLHDSATGERIHGSLDREEYLTEDGLRAFAVTYRLFSGMNSYDALPETAELSVRVEFDGSETVELKTAVPSGLVTGMTLRLRLEEELEEGQTVVWKVLEYQQQPFGETFTLYGQQLAQETDAARDTPDVWFCRKNGGGVGYTQACAAAGDLQRLTSESWSFTELFDEACQGDVRIMLGSENATTGLAVDDLASITVNGTCYDLVRDGGRFRVS